MHHGLVVDKLQLTWGTDQHCSLFRYYNILLNGTNFFERDITTYFRDVMKNLMKIKLYTEDTKVLVLNEDNFEFSNWILENFVKSENFWTSSRIEAGSNELKNTSRLHNLKKLKEKLNQNKKKQQEEEQKEKDVIWKLSVGEFLTDHRFKKMGIRFDRIICREVDDPAEVTKCLHGATQCLSPDGEFHLFYKRSGAHNKWVHDMLAERYELVVEELHFSYGPDQHPCTLYRYYNDQELLIQKMIEADKKEKNAWKADVEAD